MIIINLKNNQNHHSSSLFSFLLLLVTVKHNSSQPCNCRCCPSQQLEFHSLALAKVATANTALPSARKRDKSRPSRAEYIHHHDNYRTAGLSHSQISITTITTTKPQTHLSRDRINQYAALRRYIIHAQSQHLQIQL
jgi:hypothetical protein